MIKHIFIKILLSWSVLVVSLFASTAQNPYYYNFNLEYKFSHKEVYELMQDKSGNIWIAANPGLFMFNGKDIVHYEISQLAGKSVSIISEGKNGEIFTRNFRGQILRYSEGKYNVYLDWKDSVEQFPAIRYYEKKNWLIVTSNDKMYAFDFTNQKWLILAEDENFRYYSDIYIDKNKNIWFTSVKSIYRFSDNKVELIDSSDKRVNHIFEYHGNIHFYTADKKIYRHLPNGKIIEVKAFSNFFDKLTVFRILELGTGNLAIATSNGLYIFNQNLKPINKKAFFQGQRITHILEDREQNLWISTLDEGIFIIPDKNVLVYDNEHFNFPEKGVMSLSGSSSNHLLVGFRHGIIAQLDSFEQTRILFRNQDKREIQYITHSGKQNFYFFDNHFIQQYQNGEVKRKFDEFNFSAAKEHRILGSVQLISSGTGVDLTGKNSGLAIINLGFEPNEKLDFMYSIVLAESKDTLYHFRRRKAFSSIIDTVHQALWGAYIDGLYFFKNRTEHKFIIDSNLVYPNKLTSDIYGHIWVATNNQGLLKIKDTALVKQFVPELSVNQVSAYRNFLWFSTSTALCRLNILNDSIHIFTQADGIPSTEISQIMIDSPYVLLATPEGLVRFNLDKNPVNPVPPIIGLKSLAILENDTILQSKYVLPYFKNNIRIDLKVVSMRSLGEYSIMYRMQEENMTNDFVHSGENSLRFAALAPGEYFFEAYAINEDGIWSQEKVEIRFVIKPPFWKTLWFVLILFFVFALAVFFIFQDRINTFKKRNLLEKELKASQIRAIKAQMNPHFIFNALNSIQDLILQKDFRNAVEYLGKFSELVRMILDLSEKEWVVLNDEVELIKLYLELERLRFGDDLNTEIKIDISAADLYKYYMPGMLLQPYVENAIKHGLLHKSGEKKLFLHFYQENNILVCIIEDNGIGRAHAAEIKQRRGKHYASFSLAANKTRLELIKQLAGEQIELDIIDLQENQKPSGTRVVIKLPQKGKTLRDE